MTAADHLGLQPLAVECNADELLTLSGPAMICVRRAATGPTPSMPQAEGGPRSTVHFVGLIKQLEGDRFMVIDPAISTEALSVPRQGIVNSYAGKAILLKGCPRPSLRSDWLAFPWVILPAFLSAALCLVLVQIWKADIARLLKCWPFRTCSGVGESASPGVPGAPVP